MGRIMRIGAGVGLILLGLMLLVLPGPGIVTIAAGLALLATEFVWAANVLEWFKKRYRRYLGKEVSPLPGSAGTPPAGGRNEVSPLPGSAGSPPLERAKRRLPRRGRDEL